VTGVVLANLMFDLPAITLSTTARSGSGLWLAEGIATFGLLLVIFGVVKAGRSDVAAFAVGAYIAGAIFFTSSTAFANPAVTIARVFTDTFAGIEPSSAPAFVVAELIGTALAIGAAAFLFSHLEDVADEVVIPHGLD
jgi:glycerol uptake facilitator-like aquaporin